MRGTQLPEDFGIDGSMREWAEREVPRVNIDKEHDKFCDYFWANGKQMVSWTAAWRGWMRRCVDFKGACLYTADELQLRAMMAEYAAQGFRRAYTHENSVRYRFEFDRWKQAREGAKPRDMSGLDSLMAKMKVPA